VTERLSDVEARIGTVKQLAGVIGAMRGIAAARSREARRHLDGVAGTAAAIAAAIGQALAFLPRDRAPAPTRSGPGIHAVVALCAEQGFAGVFSDRVLDAARRLVRSETDPPAQLLLIGDRGQMVAEEHGDAVAWSAPMIAHVDQAASLANRIVEALYERLDSGRVTRVTVVHAVPDGSASIGIVERKLVPFDFDRFPVSPAAVAPRITLPPELLLARLVEEYVFAEVCEAVVLSFAAENEARMRAMIAARTNVMNTLDSLVSKSRNLRQEEITNEIVELASGAAASLGDAAGRKGTR